MDNIPDKDIETTDNNVNLTGNSEGKFPASKLSEGGGFSLGQEGNASASTGTLSKNNKFLRSIIYDIYDWVECLLLPFAAILLVMTFTVRISKVDGNSMLPTLHNFDYLLINHFLYQPNYNDIIVLQAKNLPNEQFESGKPIVKRIVGLPGDEIFVDTAAGLVYRNNERLEIEEKDGFLFEDGHMINSYSRSGELKGSITVPENSVYVLGDNRTNSLDSRFSTVGTIDKNYIVGKVVLRFFPFDNFGQVN